MEWKSQLWILATLGIGFSSAAAEVEIDRQRSVFAVVTHKAGLASGLAHNHLAAAAAYEARLDFDGTAPLAASFELTFAADGLEIDRPDLQRAWYPRLEALGILDQPFGVVSEKDRGKIRAAMLSMRQLDGARFPRLAARLAGIEERASTLGEVSFPYAVTLALEVHGETVVRSVAARYELTGGELLVEAAGTFRFTDFGIRPYSAALGMVKNADEFHVFLHLRGSVAEPGEPTD
jgi:hypothetical protein